MQTIQIQTEDHPLRRFQKRFENSSGKRLEVKINDNRSTMLSVRWEPDHTRVSLHRMFLQAPRNVMEALACYLRGEEKSLAPTIKQFIEENVQKLDYSHHIDRQQLHSRGRIYDLQEIYDEMNDTYFGGRLRLLITWFEQPKTKNRLKVTLGLYQDTLKLIKVNRILDSRDIPRYLISFVMYHEMLHAVCPPYVDESGTNHIHNKEFKRLEVRFKQYEQARIWLQENRIALFDDMN